MTLDVRGGRREFSPQHTQRSMGGQRAVSYLDPGKEKERRGEYTDKC